MTPRGSARRARGAAPPPPAEAASPAQDAGVAALERRLEHLEAMVEDLQDAFYRQAQRTDEHLLDLRRRTEPDEVARSLSDDARRRGL